MSGGTCPAASPRLGLLFVLLAALRSPPLAAATVATVGGPPARPPAAASRLPAPRGVSELVGAAGRDADHAASRHRLALLRSEGSTVSAWASRKRREEHAALPTKSMTEIKQALRTALSSRHRYSGLVQRCCSRGKRWRQTIGRRLCANVHSCDDAAYAGGGAKSALEFDRAGKDRRNVSVASADGPDGDDMTVQTQPTGFDPASTSPVPQGATPIEAEPLPNGANHPPAQVRTVTSENAVGGARVVTPDTDFASGDNFTLGDPLVHPTEAPTWTPAPTDTSTTDTSTTVSTSTVTVTTATTTTLSTTTWTSSTRTTTEPQLNITVNENEYENESPANTTTFVPDLPYAVQYRNVNHEDDGIVSASGIFELRLVASVAGQAGEELEAISNTVITTAIAEWAQVPEVDVEVCATGPEGNLYVAFNIYSRSNDDYIATHVMAAQPGDLVAIMLRLQGSEGLLELSVRRMAFATREPVLGGKWLVAQVHMADEDKLVIGAGVKNMATSAFDIALEDGLSEEEAIAVAVDVAADSSLAKGNVVDDVINDVASVVTTVVNGNDIQMIDAMTATRERVHLQCRLPTPLQPLGTEGPTPTPTPAPSEA